jgi:hypothetical protein
MAVWLSALPTGHPLPPPPPPVRFLVLISVKRLSWPQGHSMARRIRSFEKIHLIGTWSRDLPACSTVPQPTWLPHATTANTDDHLIDITYTSYSIYSNEKLLQWCEMNVPLLDHIQVVGFLDCPRCIQNQWCSSSQTATSFFATVP